MSYQLPALSNEQEFEQFICDLYNAIVGGNNFQAFGKKGNEQFGIDIYNSTLGIAIQCKKKDLNRSGLREELMDDFESTIKKLPVELNITQLIFVSTFGDNASLILHLDKLKKKYNLPFDVKYFGWDTLQRAVQDFHKVQNTYWPKYTSSWKTTIPFFEPKLLIGRKSLLKEIADYSNYQLFVLQGIAGVGKTAALSCYVNSVKNNYDSLVWLECQADQLKENMIGNLSSFYEKETRRPLKSDDWENLIAIMHNVGGNNLIVIDGIDFLDEDVYSTIEDIASTDWKVIITSRVKLGDHPSITVEGIGMKDAIELFNYHYGQKEEEDKDDELLQKILLLLETHPLLVELVAKSARANSKLSLKELYNKLRDDSIKSPELQRLIYTGIHSKKYVSDRYHQIFKYLLLCFDMNRLTDEEKEHLIHFSVLPQSQPIGIDFYLSVTLQKVYYIREIENELNSLEVKGWLNKRNDNFYIHPLIQSVALEKLEVDIDDLTSIMSACCEELEELNDIGPWKLHNYVIIAGNVLNVTGVTLHYDTFDLGFLYAKAMEAMADYARSLGYYEECIRVSNIIEGHFDPKKLSSLYNNYGNVCWKVGNYDNAKKYLNDAITTYESLPSLNPHELAIYYDNYASLQQSLGNLGETISLTKRAIESFESKKLPRYCAIAYNNLADTFSVLHEYENAAESLDKGFAALNKTKNKKDIIYADLYTTLGLLCHVTEQYEQAIIALKKALSLRKDDPNPDKLSLLHSNLAAAQLEIKDFSQAKENIDLSIKLYLSLSKGNPHNFNNIMENKINYHAAKGETDEIIGCYEQILTVFQLRYKPDHPEIKRIKDILDSFS